MEENVSAIMPVAKYATSFDLESLLVVVLESILCMFIYISLTVIVYYSVKNNKKSWVGLANLLHMMVDLLAAPAQKIILSPIIVEAGVQYGQRYYV